MSFLSREGSSNGANSKPNERTRPGIHSLPPMYSSSEPMMQSGSGSSTSTRSQNRSSNKVPLVNPYSDELRQPGSEVHLRTALEDVLPSFEMHNYMLNRKINDKEKSKSSTQVNSLPTYDEVSSGQNNTLSIEDPTAEPDKLILNNLNNIPKVDVPLKISIVITKTYPEMGTPLVRENALREFYPGDIVTGVVYIENTGSSPVPFEMVLVSLEGVSTVTHPTFKDQQVRKTFLKMFDFGACFHFGYIPTTNLNTPDDFILDETDNTLYGLSETREILPRTKHKKFFLFKIPSNLLDISCEHSLLEHVDSLPPTFGVDIQAFDGQASEIELNEVLGYGRLSNVGTPVMTKDQSEFGQSISYSVNVRILGKKGDAYAKYKADLSHDSDFLMLSELQHFFRFTPVDMSTLKRTLYSNRGNGAKNASSSKGNENEDDDMEFRQPNTSIQIQNLFRIANDKVVELEERERLMKIGVDANEELLELTYDIPNLADYTNNTANEKKRSQLKLKTTVDPILEKSSAEGDLIKCEKTVDLIKKEKAFGFNKKKIELVGSMTMKVGLHKEDKLPPITPRTLTKLANTIPKAASNSVNTLAPQSPAESPNLSPALSPVASASSARNMDLSPISSMTSMVSSASLSEIPYMGSSISAALTPYLTAIVIELEYTPSGADDTIPEIVSVTPGLRSVVLSTPNPNPIVFEELLFTSDSIKESHSALNKIKEQATSYITQIKELCKKTNKGVPKQLFYDLIALSYCKINEQKTPLFKQVQTARGEIEQLSKWEKFTKPGSKKVSYKKRIRIPLIEDTNISKNSSIIPTFTNCFFSKYYYLQLTFAFKKTQTPESSNICLDVPVKVSKIL